MIEPGHPSIAQHCQNLAARIRAQGAGQWLEGKIERQDRDALVYLCKFAFMTALITKSEIAAILELDRSELKALVRGWYDDHRAKGCGMC